jgi:uncharacterized membrane protein YqiK
MNLPFWLIGTLAGLVIFVVFVFGFALLVKNFYKKVLPGEALINNKTRGITEVSFQGSLVLPIVHKAEVMDISVKTIEIDRRGKEGLICADNIRADIKVTFFVRVNPTEDDVKKVAQSIGCARASDQRTLEELFVAKFSEALKTVGYQMRFVALYTQRDHFKEAIVKTIGQDLNGYSLEDAAIDFLEQTPLDSLDPQNILDAEGIRAITEITSVKSVETNRLQNDEKKRIKKQDVEGREAILALERQQSVAEAQQAREIATVRAREKATVETVQAEEYLKSESAKIRANEELEIARENKDRQVAVAEKNKQRVIAVEGERVEKDRALEQVVRERETEVARIEKEKILEQERKEIAEVVRARVIVDKSVAEEEERIKDLRAVAEANRHRDVTVIAAEAEAQENLVRDIKAAEASEKAASHRARERVVMADAELEAADRVAKAKIRNAEGVQAEVAAHGLAEAKVQEAHAIALEKTGMVQARVTREKLMAEAQGEQEKGFSLMRVREADAAVVERLGAAEAKATELKLGAEAKGLTEKAEAMKKLDGVGREHEEFRLRLEKDKSVELEAIHAQKDMAAYQASVLGEAFKNAKIDIVGGDGAFFDKFVSAVSMGKSVDGFVNKSNVTQTAMKSYLDGSRSLPDDVSNILSNPRVGSADLQRLSITAFLTQMMTTASDPEKTKLNALLKAAEKLGIGAISGDAE